MRPSTTSSRKFFFKPYYEGKFGIFDNYLIEINLDSEKEVKVDFTSDITGGPSIDDDDNIYLCRVDKMVAF